MTSCAMPHHIMVINFSTPSAYPRVLIGRPINCTFHCPAFTLPNWISFCHCDCYYECTCISMLHSLHPCAIFQWETQSQMTHGNFSFDSYFCYHSALLFSPSFAHPLHWVQHCCFFLQTSAITWWLFYSHRKVNLISITLEAWWSVGFSWKLWTH